MINNIYSDPINWISSQIKQLNKLVKIFYVDSTSNVSSDEYKKIRAALHTAEHTINEILPKCDISTHGCSSIFAPYAMEEKEKISFEEYFNKNLNPDIALPGFLEELDELIQITKIRKVVISTNGTEIEMEQAKVLQDYLSSIPPF